MRSNTTNAIGIIGFIIPPSFDARNRVIIVTIPEATPRKVKMIPPTNSWFHDMIRIANKMNEGMLCTNRPTTVFQKV